MSKKSGNVSKEEEKIELEVKEIQEKLENLERPFWKQNGFSNLIIPVFATLFVSLITFGYQVYRENFSELVPIQKANLLLTNNQLRLQNEDLEFEAQEKRGLLAFLKSEAESLNKQSAELTAENESLIASVENANASLDAANAALSGTRAEMEALRLAGEHLASVRTVLAAYTEICRAAEAEGLTQLQSAIVPHAEKLAAQLVDFEMSNSDKFGRLSFNRCDGLVRTTATAAIWLGEPECLGKWASHVEVRRLLLAVKSLEKAPVMELVEDGAITSVRKVHLSEFEKMIEDLRFNADFSRCRR